MKIPTGWEQFFKEEKQKPYFEELMKFLKNEYETKTIYPPKENIFTVFNLVKPEDVKVVLLGQDPYHGYNQANGIAFSTNDSKTPRSLANMFKELNNDLGIEHPSNDLTGWVKQGVFLLNTILTVREHEPLSHKNKGWEIFVLDLLNFLEQTNHNVLFCAFGNNAYEMYSKITNINSQDILRFGHPSPFSYERYFKNTKPYSAINNWLIEHNENPIDWSK
ncbi:uracil-DNA glycosylase [Mesoplasma lactucae]|uniref:Uracil-DNA glycosylase n=1 Tax=Mesoplasma lactucae ATCC 49193 TaxID=81460 RepID=A0A291IS31_9MOLU|nr:uracil-DNA glycosylase [Mesoplasma lactucae]ATG97672.1 uracil-DNA glycosylase [Mesoplasma lactucae ATCC 49193]ATZ19863.1 uracil-DNA glycosylase [Mesoplasma lactucae ATCC 49193]MCL8216726.1 Uracil-DNA glycosylase [Mesoplasma lactucae ATCC 49193]